MDVLYRKPGPHRTRQRCSDSVCDRPSPARSVPSKSPVGPPGGGFDSPRNGTGRARTVANRAGTALTGAVSTGLKSGPPLGVAVSASLSPAAFQPAHSAAVTAAQVPAAATTAATGE